MAYTALNLITDVLLDMGVIADEDTPTASQAVGGLTKLNDLISAWNLDPLAVFGAKEYIIPFVANQGVYTIGPSGNLNIPRPDIITSAFIRNTFQPSSQQFDTPITIFTNDQWANVPNKSATGGGFPFLGVWFNETYPLISASVTPIPTNGQYSLVFWADGMNGSLTLNTVLSLPPGYNRALKYALFIEMAPSYGIQVPQEIALLASSSKYGIDRHNLQINQLVTSQRGYYNIYGNVIVRDNQ